MYKLTTGDKDNIKVYNVLEANFELKQKVLNASKDLEMACHFILSQPITEDDYDKYEAILTVSDENNLIPLGYKTALLYYFILNVNYQYFNGKSSNRLSTLGHAHYLYNLTNGDYTKLDPITTNDGARYTTFKANHRALFKGVNVVWKLPVSFHKEKKTGKKVVLLGGESWATFAYISINEGQEYKVPRDLFIPFFEDTIKRDVVVKGSTTDDIQLAFDVTLEKPLFEVLRYIGYNIFKSIILDTQNIDYYYEDNALFAKLLNRRAVLFSDEDDDSKVYWKLLQNNIYRYLSKEVEYIPSNAKDNKLTIFRR